MASGDTVLYGADGAELLDASGNVKVSDTTTAGCCCTCDGGTCTHMTSGGKPNSFQMVGSGIAIESGCILPSPSPGFSGEKSIRFASPGDPNGVGCAGPVDCRYSKTISSVACYDRYSNADCTNYLGSSATCGVSYSLEFANSTTVLMRVLVFQGLLFRATATRNVDNYASYTFTNSLTSGVGTVFTETLGGNAGTPYYIFGPNTGTITATPCCTP